MVEARKEKPPGWTGVPSPRAGMFVWAPLPAPWRELGSMEFARRLMEDAEVAARLHEAGWPVLFLPEPLWCQGLRSSVMSTPLSWAAGVSRRTSRRPFA